MSIEPPFPIDRNVHFYNSEGRPVFYLRQGGKYFYHYDGTPLGYLYFNKYIISFSGEYLGWVRNGFILDYIDGTYAFFTRGASGGPSKPAKKTRPSKKTRKARPIKNVRRTKPSKPSRTYQWSSRSSEIFFPDYTF